MAGSSVLAQPQNGEQLEEVLVTGSYIRRAADSSSPMTILSQEDLNYTPRSSIGEILHADPAFNGSNVFTSFGTGLGTSTSATINLRGLGPRATLVLLNGGRSVNNSQPNRDGEVTFDVNSLIPAIAIERVEVLKDGASALYGTDAVAGVVNFITRNDFEGFELETSWQQTDVGGAEERLIAGIFGHGNDEGSHMIVAFEHLDRDPFDYLSHSDVYAFNEANPILGSYGSPGSFRLVPGETYNAAVPAGSDNRLIRDPMCGDPSLGPGNIAGVPSFLGNPANDNQICAADVRLGRATISGVERTSAYTRGTHALGTINVGAEVGFTHAAFDRAAGFGRSTPEALLPEEHPQNVFGGDVLWRGSTVGAPAGRDNANIFEASTNTWRAALFADGIIREQGNWRWDSKLTWSVNEAFSQNRNAMPSRMENALLGLGGYGCDPASGTPGAGPCEYFNPFASRYLASPGDPAHNSQELIDYVMPFSENISESRLITATAVVSGDVFELPAGPAGVAFGYEFRNYGMANDFDPVTLAGGFGGNREVPFDADRDENAAFFELVLPAATQLELQLAGRYEDYGQGIDEFVPKIGMMWTPQEDLFIRATYGRGFKAPGLVPTYATSAGLTDTVDVPGIEAGFPLTVTRPNPDLEPEKGEAYTAGITWDTTDSFTVSVDWWRLDSSDITGQESAQLVVQEYAATGANADRLTFDESGVLTDIDLVFDNFAALNAEGIDFRFDWDFDVGSTGSLQFNTSASYLMAYEYQLRADQPIVDGLGRANERVFAYAAPEWKANASLSWSINAHYLRGTLRYIDGMLSDRLPDDDPNQTDQGYTQLDLIYAYTLAASGNPLELRFAINDVTDERPPIFTGGQMALPGMYDSRGRNFSVGLTKTF